MRRKPIDEIKVGLFVFAGAFVIMLFIFMLGGKQSLFPRYYKLFAHFDDISGLRVGAPIQLAGVKIGFVSEIRFPKNIKEKWVTICMKVDKKYKSRVRQDSAVTIDTMGLLGDKFIAITVGSADEPVLEAGSVVQSKEVTSLFNLGKKAGVMIDDISAAAKSLREILQQVEGKSGSGELKRTLTALRKTIERAQKGPGFVHALFYDPKGEDVIANLSRIFNSAANIMEEADKEAPGEIGGLISNLRQASADLRRILAAIRRGEGTAGKLVMDPTLYENMKLLFEGLSKRRVLRTIIRQTIQNTQQAHGVPTVNGEQ